MYLLSWYHILCQYKQAFIVLRCSRMRNISVKVEQLLININPYSVWCASLSPSHGTV